MNNISMNENKYGRIQPTMTTRIQATGLARLQTKYLYWYVLNLKQAFFMAGMLMSVSD